MEEKWKDIEGYEGLYQVSNLGRVKRILFVNNIITKPINKILNCSKIDNLGYPQVTLCKNGHRKYLRIHRIVAKSFIPNPNNYPCVNHIDGNKRNNCISNLEWCNHSYNTIHALNTGLINAEKRNKASKENIKKAQKSSPCLKGGENSPSSVLRENDVIEIRRIYKNKEMSSRQLAEKYKVHISTIQRVLSRKTWNYLK